MNHELGRLLGLLLGVIVRTELSGKTGAPVPAGVIAVMPSRGFI